MTEVIARLREAGSEATEEIAELYFAVREIALNSRRFDVSLREVAAETAALAADPASASAERLKNLSTYAAGVHNAAEAQRAALVELQRGLEGWGFVPS